MWSKFIGIDVVAENGSGADNSKNLAFCQLFIFMKITHISLPISLKVGQWFSNSLHICNTGTIIHHWSKFWAWQTITCRDTGIKKFCKIGILPKLLISIMESPNFMEMRYLQYSCNQYTFWDILWKNNQYLVIMFNCCHRNRSWIW